MAAPLQQQLCEPVNSSHHVQQQVDRLSVASRHLVRFLADLQQAGRGQLHTQKRVVNTRTSHETKQGCVRSGPRILAAWMSSTYGKLEKKKINKQN